METKNLDVSLLGNEILVFRSEIEKMQSGGVFNVGEYDLARLDSYLARVERDLEHVKGQPKLDLPKWHAKSIAMPEMKEDYSQDNPSVVYVLRILDAAYFELLSSQSSDLSNGLEIADADRLTKVLERLKSWLAALRDTQEIDTPEGANTNS